MITLCRRWVSIGILSIVVAGQIFGFVMSVPLPLTLNRSVLLLLLMLLVLELFVLLLSTTVDSGGYRVCVVLSVLVVRVCHCWVWYKEGKEGGVVGGLLFEVVTVRVQRGDHPVNSVKYDKLIATRGGITGLYFITQPHHCTTLYLLMLLYLSLSSYIPVKRPLYRPHKGRAGTEERIRAHEPKCV